MPAIARKMMNPIRDCLTMPAFDTEPHTEPHAELKPEPHTAPAARHETVQETIHEASLEASDIGDLHSIAFKSELAASRRLARCNAQPPAAALAIVLGRAAKGQSLAQLVASRRQAQQACERAREIRLRRQQEKQQRHHARRQSVGQGDGHTWHAHFDGSAHPNPGRLGIGATLTGPRGQAYTLSRRAGHGDSSDAEYLALIAILEAALEAGATPLALFGDSRVVIDDINNARQRPPPHAAGRLSAAGNARFAGYRARALALLSQLERVTLNWLPRKKNAAADALSQQAIRYHDCPLADCEQNHE